mmetsp:Transcript_42806/g.106928  ORF Transcript_42806/g.106928 Transcript_42806/m.106928 type:complete len:285 (-) Transcript_42806:192-1046(-)
MLSAHPTAALLAQWKMEGWISPRRQRGKATSSDLRHDLTRFEYSTFSLLAASSSTVRACRMRASIPLSTSACCCVIHRRSAPLLSSCVRELSAASSTRMVRSLRYCGGLVNHGASPNAASDSKSFSRSASVFLYISSVWAKKVSSSRPWPCFLGAEIRSSNTALNSLRKSGDSCEAEGGRRVEDGQAGLLHGSRPRPRNRSAIRTSSRRSLSRGSSWCAANTRSRHCRRLTRCRLRAVPRSHNATAACSVRHCGCSFVTPARMPFSLSLNLSRYRSAHCDVHCV